MLLYHTTRHAVGSYVFVPHPWLNVLCSVLNITYPRIQQGLARCCVRSEHALLLWTSKWPAAVQARPSTLFVTVPPACATVPPQDKYGGFNSSDLVDDFVYYADVVFKELGPLVKYWVTFNEPLVTCMLGYYLGKLVCR